MVSTFTQHQRPEHTGPPDLFYTPEEARKYAQNSHMMEVQTKMSERALELLALPEDQTCYLLDLGCGTGLSGEVLTDYGHFWVGLDITPTMLGMALERRVDGDLLQSDLGQGVPFRTASFDGAISISTLQWLCNADTSWNIPRQRLTTFFSSLYACLRRGAKAVFQLYPEPFQMELICQCAFKVGFGGGLVVDYPNSTKAKKAYLCLCAGNPTFQPPDPLLEEHNQKAARSGLVIPNSSSVVSLNQRRKKWKKSSRTIIKDKNWVKTKKEIMRKKGRQIARDSKYTARKRRPKF